MTVHVGKKEIILGWETGAAIVLFLVSTMFGAGMVTSKFLAKQDKIYNVILLYPKNDSITKADIASIKTTVSTHTRQIDSIARNSKPNRITYNPPPPQKYYTERKVNGKIILIPTNIQ